MPAPETPAELAVLDRLIREAQSVDRLCRTFRFPKHLDRGSVYRWYRNKRITDKDLIQYLREIDADKTP